MRVPVRTKAAPPTPTTLIERVESRASTVEGASSTRRRAAPIGASVAGLVVITAAVLTISAFSPDLVAGPGGDHTPIAAQLTWVWGLIAAGTLGITLLGDRERPDRTAGWFLAADVAIVWALSAAISIFGPQMTTGADPTSVPICALLAPIAATVLTLTGCRLFLSLGDGGRTRSATSSASSTRSHVRPLPGRG